jgi:hypothetical protein
VTGALGTISGISSTTGRGTLTFSSGTFTNHEAIYIVDANEMLLVQTDQFDGGTPIASGTAVATPSSYTSASLSGNQIIHLTGRSNGVATANLGLLSISPAVGSAGSFSGVVQNFSDGATSTTTITGETYTVNASSGRVALSSSGDSPIVLYLTTPTDGISSFAVDTDVDAGFGVTEFQPAVTYSASSLSGVYFYGKETPGDSSVVHIVGQLTVQDNAGTIQFLQDGSDGGLGTDGSSSEILSVNTDGTGSGVDSNTLTTNIFLVTNGTKLFFVVPSGVAAIRVVEQ